MTDLAVGISAEEARILSDMYWAEEAEFEAGIHPTQVKERIIESLTLHEVDFNEITFLDWTPEGSRVRVSLDGTVFAIFNYSTNKWDFEEE